MNRQDLYDWAFMLAFVALMTALVITSAIFALI